MTQVVITDDPFAGKAEAEPGRWPGEWIACPDAGPAPFVCVFRCRFTAARAETVRVHVSADERYELFLDGTRMGRGPERGDPENWFFETYDLALAAGEHVLAARVWALGDLAPFAQMSVRPGFLLCPDAETWRQMLGTGVAAWDAKRLGGYEFRQAGDAWGSGANETVDGTEYPWGAELGQGGGWQPAEAGTRSAGTAALNDSPPIHRLRPATLPPQRAVRWTQGHIRYAAALPAHTETFAIPIQAAGSSVADTAAWQALWDHAEAVTVPPHARRRVLLDLEDYVCAYLALTVSGGAGSRIKIAWQEALYDSLDAEDKGDRDAVEGKYFRGAWWPHEAAGDVFLPGGEPNPSTFAPLWWRCGRYVESVVETAAAPLTIHALTLAETRYPLEWTGRFEADDPRLSSVVHLSLQALQMCAHETFLDCPFYEQLQYVGDTRLQALAGYAISDDDRLARKALALFDASRLSSGLIQSRYPSRVRQETRPFTLAFAGMAHDYALWRDDPAFVRSLLPGVRAALAGFGQFAGADSLAALPPGPNLNFVDWVPGWEGGVPPGSSSGVNSVVNWQWARALSESALLEDGFGEPELAALFRRQSSALAARMDAVFWDEERGLYADDPAHAHFSEHAQALAILSGHLSENQKTRVGQNLLSAPDLARTTVYFSHFLFEAFSALGRADALLARLPLWFELAGQGLKTTIEMPEPARSDCHGWGAHPLFHFYATLLGIRPAAFGFRSVRIAPCFGPLTRLAGVMPHPRGEIAVRLERGAETLQAEITLPPETTGIFEYAGAVRELRQGRQAFVLAIRQADASL